MLFWTHLVVGLFGIFLYLPYSDNPWIFFFVALVSSVLPDIDSPRSRIGRNGFSKTLMAFVRHRGVVHSLIFMFLIYLILFNVWEVASFPFLFGYSIHLFLDCFTIRGVRLFYPFKRRFKFFVRSGGKVEMFIFVLFFILDCFLFSVLLFRVS